jgi:hypothetical protein
MAGGMRELQRTALLALTAHATPLPTLQHLAASSPIAAACERNGELVAIVGAVIVHPGVANTFLYATDDFKKVILEVTHWYKALFSALKILNIHRVQSLGPADDPAGHRWKENVLGARLEARLEKFGKNGESFVLHTVML